MRAEKALDIWPFDFPDTRRFAGTVAGGGSSRFGACAWGREATTNHFDTSRPAFLKHDLSQSLSPLLWIVMRLENMRFNAGDIEGTDQQ